MPSHVAQVPLTRWRADTPGASDHVHLNNAGSSLMPRPVLEAMQAHLELEARHGGYEAADERSEAVAQVYAGLAELVRAQPRNIALTASATAGFIQALSSFAFQAGDVILTTRADYPSYQIQLLSLARRCGVKIVHAEDLPEGGVDPDSVRRLAIATRPKLVTVSWVPTHSGTVQDVAAVGEVCAELGIPYHVDACQAAGQIPIDVARLKCDYLSGTARKFLRGPRGMGFLYASDAAMARGDHPLFVDMRGATWVAKDRYQLADSALRYEDWEFPYALVLGFGAALGYASGVGIATAQRYAWAHARRLRDALGAVPGVRVLDRGHERCAIVTAEVQGRDAAPVQAALRARGIMAGVTLGWYGLLDIGERGISSALRFSPHYYNSDEEIDQAIERLREVLA